MSNLTSITLEHHGGGWLTFDCPPLPLDDSHQIKLLIKANASTSHSPRLSKINQIKLKLAKLITWDPNERAIIDILAQTLAHDGTVSLNGQIKQLSLSTATDPSEHTLIWASIQLDGDISFGINRTLLECPQYRQYCNSFEQVQHQFMSTIQSAIKAISRNFNRIIASFATIAAGSSIYVAAAQFLFA